MGMDKERADLVVMDYEADNEKGLFPISFLMDKECTLTASFGIF